MLSLFYLIFKAAVSQIPSQISKYYCMACEKSLQQRMLQESYCYILKETIKKSTELSKSGDYKNVASNTNSIGI